MIITITIQIAMWSQVSFWQVIHSYVHVWFSGVISYIEASDFNISAANKHETENGAKACNRTRHEKPKLATEGKAKTANQVAAHYHTNDRTRDHHHSSQDISRGRINIEDSLNVFGAKNNKGIDNNDLSYSKHGEQKPNRIEKNGEEVQ